MAGRPHTLVLVMADMLPPSAKASSGLIARGMTIHTKSVRLWPGLLICDLV